MGLDYTIGESVGRFGPLGSQFWAFQGSKGGNWKVEKLKSKWREKREEREGIFCWLCAGL